MENSNSPSLESGQESKLIHWQDLLQYGMIVGLFFIGFLIELSPKWDESLIHIPISPGHGFTTQDAAALIPISIGLFLFVRVIWQYRLKMKLWIQDAPVNAFGLALILGLIVGTILGIGLGVLFKIPIVSLLKDTLKPIRTLFFGS